MIHKHIIKVFKILHPPYRRWYHCSRSGYKTWYGSCNFNVSILHELLPTNHSYSHCPGHCHNRQHRRYSAGHISPWWCPRRTWNIWLCTYNLDITRPTFHILPITFDDVFNPKIPSEANSFQTAPITISNDMFKSLAKKVVIYYVLQYYLFAYLKFIRWKHD